MSEDLIWLKRTMESPCDLVSSLPHRLLRIDSTPRLYFQFWTGLDPASIPACPFDRYLPYPISLVLLAHHQVNLERGTSLHDCRDREKSQLANKHQPSQGWTNSMAILRVSSDFCFSFICCIYSITFLALWDSLDFLFLFVTFCRHCSLGFYDFTVSIYLISASSLACLLQAFLPYPAFRSQSHFLKCYLDESWGCEQEIHTWIWGLKILDLLFFFFLSLCFSLFWLEVSPNMWDQVVLCPKQGCINLLFS